MKRRIVLGCLLPLLVVAGLVWWGIRLFSGAAATPARFATVDRGDVEIKVIETGTIEPLKKVEVKSKVAGRVARLVVQEGDHVRKGDVLSEIDPTEINSQVAQIRAQRDGAQARYEQAVRAARYQKEQTKATLRQNEEALRSAEARLRVAREENKAQPNLTASDMAQAEAGLKSAQDNLTLLKQATHPQAVVAAETGLQDASASAENAKRNLARQQRLFDRGFVSEQVVDAARADLAAANARRDQAQKRMDLIAEQNRLEVANADSRVAEARAALERAKANRSFTAVKNEEVKAAEAAVAQARSQLALAKRGFEQDKMREDDVAAALSGVKQIDNQLQEFAVRQGDTQLIAGMDGVVTRRYIEQGELVTSGVSTFSSGTPVLQIADLSRMLVKMSVNEVDVHKIRIGLPVEITIDGARGEVFMGKVRQVAPAAVGTGAAGEGQPQNQGGGNRGVIRFAVEIEVARPDPRLRPGMSAKCTIVIARKRSALRLPSDCIEGKGAQAKVQILSRTQKDGKTVDTYTPRPVTVGLEGDSYVEIVSGVKEGEQVKPGVYSGPPRKALGLDFE